MSKLLAALGFAGGLAAAAAAWLLWPSEPPQRSAAELMDVLMWNREPVGGPFRSSITTASRAPTPISAAS